LIKRPTVLILGAGASKPYGFPLGRELLYKIRNALDPSGTSDLRDKLLKQGIDPHQIDTFHRELSYADPPSVDAFLEFRQEFLMVGKLAITISLIEREIEKNRLFEKPINNPHWYQYLIEKMITPSFDDFGENKISIITFNYERSIEHYFFKVLKSRYNRADEECAIILNKIPIIHVHGKIGALPWQSESGRPYSPKIDQKSVKKISEQIKVITEDVYPSSEFKKALHFMNTADEIMFLGFGYHEANLRRLEVNKLRKKDIFGTSYGLSKNDVLTLHIQWGIEFPGHPCKILQLLQEHVRLE